jgi:hypothetical protein
MNASPKNYRVHNLLKITWNVQQQQPYFESKTPLAGAAASLLKPSDSGGGDEEDRGSKPA